MHAMARFSQGSGLGRFVSGGLARWSSLRHFAEAAALRPFYGLVHPDLFGRYPEERATNEESLKRLHQYFDAARNRRNMSLFESRNLTFYVWNRDRDHFDRISIPLLASGAHSTVRSILTMCGLQPPLPRTENTNSRSPPIGGLTMYTDAFNFDFESVFTAKRSSSTLKKKELSVFLSSVADQARQRARASSLSRQQAKSLTVLLGWQYGIRSIVDISEWGAVARLAALRRLEHLLGRKMCSSGSESVSLGGSLRGQHLVLGNDTCVDTLGRVRLSSLDVPEKWTELLLNISSDLSRLRALALVENQIRPLLGGVQLKRPSWLSAQSYRHGVEQLYLSAQRARRSLTVPPGQLRDLRVFVDRVSPQLHLRPDGVFLCPPLASPHDIHQFVLTHKQDALEKMAKHKRLSAEVNKMMAQAVKVLSLASLKCDEHLPLTDAHCGLERLLRLDSTQAQGLHLRLSSCFALSSDGEVYIACHG